jgi:hypothetical protein
MQIQHTAVMSEAAPSPPDPDTSTSRSRRGAIRHRHVQGILVPTQGQRVHPGHVASRTFTTRPGSVPSRSRRASHPTPPRLGSLVSSRVSIVRGSPTRVMWREPHLHHLTRHRVRPEVGVRPIRHRRRRMFSPFPGSRPPPVRTGSTPTQQPAGPPGAVRAEGRERGRTEDFDMRVPRVTSSGARCATQGPDDRPCGLPYLQGTLAAHTRSLKTSVS